MAAAAYESLRQKYRPHEIEWLFVTESPPPGPEKTESTRQFYRIGSYNNDRLFWNTMRALYPEAKAITESQLEQDKDSWLRRFQKDGCYQIESLEGSLSHETATTQRHHALKDALPEIEAKIKSLAGPDTKVLLIKSTVFKMTFEPLKNAGINVINTTFLDYPGFWREQQYVEKLSTLMSENGWEASKTPRSQR